MDQSLVSVSFDIPELKKSADQVKKIFLEVQAIIDKLQENKVQLLNIKSLGELKANREEAGRLGNSLEQLGKKYNELLASVQKLKQTQQEGTKASDDAAKNTDKARTALQQLNDQYKAAFNNAKEMLQVYGSQSKEFQQATAEAAKYKAQLEAINSTTLKAVKQNVAPAASAPATTTPIISTDNLAALEAEQQALAQTGERVSALEIEQQKGEAAAIAWANAQKNAADSVGAAGTATEQAAANTAAVVGAYDEFTGALQQNIALMLENDLALQENAIQQKAINKEIKASGFATDEQKAKLVALKEEQLLLTANNKQLLVTTQNQAKAFIAEGGSVDELRAHVKLLEQSFNQLSVAEQGAAQGQKIQSELNIVNTAITSVEGGAKKAAGGLSVLNKGFGFLKSAAYVLPGIGLAGLFNLIFEQVTKLSTALFTNSKAFDANVATAKHVADTLDNINSTYGQSVEAVTELGIKVELARKGLIDKNVVLEQYKQKLGDTFGKVKDLNDVEAILADKDKVKAYLDAQLLKAAGLLALQDAAKKALDAEKERRKELQDFGKFIDVNPAGAIGGSALTVEQIRKQNEILTKAQQERKNAAIKTAEDEKKAQEDIADKFFNDAYTLAQKFGINLDGLTHSQNNANISKLKSYLQDLLKAQQEGNKIRLEDEIKFRQAIADSEGFGTNERVLQANEASKLRLQLIKENERAELEQVQASRAAALKEYSDSETKVNDNTKIKADERNKLLGDAAKERNIAEAASEQQRQNIIAKANIAITNEEISTITETAKLRKDAHDKELAEAKTTYEKIHAFDKLFSDPDDKPGQNKDKLLAATIEQEHSAFQNLQAIRAANYAKQKEQIQQQYTDGITGFKEYQAQLSKAETDNQKTATQDLIDSLNIQLDTYKKLGTIGSAEAQKVSAALADAQVKLTSLTDLPSSSIEKLKGTFQEIAGYITQATELLGGVISNITEKQKTALQDIEDQQEENYEKEVERINNSTLKEQDKADRLTILDAQRTAQKEINARKEKQIERQQASFDKAANISKIITETALAVINALADKTVPYPVRVGYAIAAGAVGLAELAIATRAPLPAYRTGVKSSPETFAKVGEAGRELRIEPTGELSFTPDKEAITYLKAGTQIIPNEKVNDYLLNLNLPKYEPFDNNFILASANRAMASQSKMMAYYAQNKENGNTDVVKAIDKLSNLSMQQLRAFKKIKAPTITISDNSAFLEWKWDKQQFGRPNPYRKG